MDLHTLHCTAQWCVFNNSSIVKHRHRLFSILAFKDEIINWSWDITKISKTSYDYDFSSNEFCHKWAIVFIFVFWKTTTFFLTYFANKKKILFLYKKNIFESMLIFQNFKSFFLAYLDNLGNFCNPLRPKFYLSEG